MHGRRARARPSAMPPARGSSTAARSSAARAPERRPEGRGHGGGVAHGGGSASAASAFCALTLSSGAWRRRSEPAFAGAGTTRLRMCASATSTSPTPRMAPRAMPGHARPPRCTTRRSERCDSRAANGRYSYAGQNAGLRGASLRAMERAGSPWLPPLAAAVLTGRPSARRASWWDHALVGISVAARWSPGGSASSRLALHHRSSDGGRGRPAIARIGAQAPAKSPGAAPRADVPRGAAADSTARCKRRASAPCRGRSQKRLHGGGRWRTIDGFRLDARRRSERLAVAAGAMAGEVFAIPPYARHRIAAATRWAVLLPRARRRGRAPVLRHLRCAPSPPPSCELDAGPPATVSGDAVPSRSRCPPARGRQRCHDAVTNSAVLGAGRARRRAASWADPRSVRRHGADVGLPTVVYLTGAPAGQRRRRGQRAERAPRARRLSRVLLQQVLCCAGVGGRRVCWRPARSPPPCAASDPSNSAILRGLVYGARLAIGTAPGCINIVTH